jgi:hypothetical protein
MTPAALPRLRLDIGEHERVERRDAAAHPGADQQQARDHQRDRAVHATLGDRPEQEAVAGDDPLDRAVPA